MIPAAILALAAANAPLQIDLWTMGSGDHLYERFGHAALRVQSSRSDLLYNYGVADFGASGFMVDFLRGRSRFWLSVESPEASLAHYKRRNRSVYAQRLTLDDRRLAWLAGRLRTNALPKNRYYRYHHFGDNCTTRIRDLLDEASHGRLAKVRHVRTDRTFRRHMREGFSGMPGLLFATEFVGRPTDAFPDRWERMFLPHALREEVAIAGIAQPVVTLHRRSGPSPLTGESQGARALLWVVAGLAAVLLYLGARQGGALARAAMACAGTVSTLIAVPLGVVALLSFQDELRHNENLLVFWPTDILLVWGNRPWARGYLRIRAGVALLLVLYRAGGLLVQDNFPLLALGVALFAAVDLGLRRSPS